MQMNLIKMLSRSSSLEKSKICYILQGGRDLENEVALPLGEAEARFVFTKTNLRQGEHVTRSLTVLCIHSFTHMLTYSSRNVVVYRASP